MFALRSCPWLTGGCCCQPVCPGRGAGTSAGGAVLTVTVLETFPRFGGRLQLDRSVEDVKTTFAMISAGEVVRPSRCERVWLGASDLQEEVGQMVQGEEG